MFNFDIASSLKLRMKEIEDIYFFEVNTNYILSNALKISVILRVRTFNTFVR